MLTPPWFLTHIFWGAACHCEGIMAPVPGQKRLMIIKMVLENFKVNCCSYSREDSDTCSTCLRFDYIMDSHVHFDAECV